MAKRQTKKTTPKVVEPVIEETIEEIETVEIEPTQEEPVQETIIEAQPILTDEEVERKIKEDFSEILLYDEFHKLIHTTIASKVTFFVDIKGLYKKYIDQCATSNETNDTLADRGHIVNWALKELL